MESRAGGEGIEIPKVRAAARMQIAREVILIEITTAPEIGASFISGHESISSMFSSVNAA
ncbi:MAG TPA: hypothetical protein VIF02_16445 [Methylocella sp.]